MIRMKGKRIMHGMIRFDSPGPGSSSSIEREGKVNEEDFYLKC